MCRNSHPAAGPKNPGPLKPTRREHDAPTVSVRAAYALANTVDLLKIGGYIPAVENLQEAVLTSMKNEYPGVDFQAALDGLNHLSQPSTVSPIPAGMEAKFEDIRDRISTVQGLDLDTELDKLDAEIKTVPVK